MKRTTWANVAVIVAALYSLVAAAWSPVALFGGGEGYGVANRAWLMFSYAGASTLALAGLVVAQHWRFPGRIAVVIAGLLALSGLFVLQPIKALAVLSLGGTGLLLLAAAPFMGEMPAAFQERREERPT